MLECFLVLGKLVFEEDIDGLLKPLDLGGFEPLHMGLVLYLKPLLAVLIPLFSP